jgi:hypothetical protein
MQLLRRLKEAGLAESFGCSMEGGVEAVEGMEEFPDAIGRPTPAGPAAQDQTLIPVFCRFLGLMQVVTAGFRDLSHSMMRRTAISLASILPSPYNATMVES